MESVLQTRPARQQARARKPQVRSFRILKTVTEQGGQIRLTVDGKSQDYAVRWFYVSADMGFVGFEWKKPDSEVYHCLAQRDNSVSCDCRGHVAHGHCKHSACVRVLLERGEA